MGARELEEAHFFHTYKRLPLEIERGEGVYLYTADGRRYLDMFAGVAVNALGHGHPAVLRAIEHQVRKYIHVSNYFLQSPQLELAEMLTRYSGYERVFFSNSGTEAVDGAIKIARKWGVRAGKSKIISFTQAFHGRTMGALSLMDRPGYLDGFGPFLANSAHIEFNNEEQLRSSVGDDTAAVVLEFIQGEAGVQPVQQSFVDELRQLQSRFGFLLVADEIQSGLGRTGKFFAFQHFNITPDIVLVAKPLGGGLPLGAILGGTRVANVLEPGNHGTTFGGNPVACAAGVAVLREIMEGGLIVNAATVGAQLQQELLTIQQEFANRIRQVRGAGLMVGMELNDPCESAVTALRERGVLVNGTAERVLRFVPPLILGEEHVKETAAALRSFLHTTG